MPAPAHASRCQLTPDVTNFYHYGPTNFTGAALSFGVELISPGQLINVYGVVHTVGAVHATDYTWTLHFRSAAFVELPPSCTFTAHVGTGGTVEFHCQAPLTTNHWYVLIQSNSLTTSTDTVELWIDTGAVPQLYLHSEDQAGFVYDSEATSHWRQLTALLGTSSGGHNWISTMTTPRDNANVVYAFPSSDDSMYASLDGGLTFTDYVIGAAAANVSEAVSRVAGEIHFQTGSGSGLQGIWRSTNGGTSWTHIVTQSGAGLALGTTKLWYAEQIGATVAIRQCNLDGSGVTTIASSGTFLGQIRAISDDFCIVVSGASNQIIRVGSDGSVTDIKPSGIDKPWDVGILDATSWLIIGTSNAPALFRHGLVYRTDSGGTTQVADFTPAQSWVEFGVYDSYHLIEVPWGSSTTAYVLGNASATVRQMIWYTADRGTTWTLLENEADPVDTGGLYLVFGPGGIGGARPVPVVALAAIPARLATIVG